MAVQERVPRRKCRAEREDAGRRSQKHRQRGQPASRRCWNSNSRWGGDQFTEVYGNGEGELDAPQHKQCRPDAWRAGTWVIETCNE